MNTTLRRWRQIVNATALGLSAGAAAIGLLFLGWILAVTLARGATAIRWTLFTSITAHGAEGGLLNALAGSAVMDAMALALCTPIGMGAGIFLAEYARHTPLGSTIRFLNDILLSAPSIVLGLFVYVLVVLPTTWASHGDLSFSGVAGAIALALIGLPVIVRTTDEMLQLVPRTLGEAALALGIPRWKVTLQITLRAASAGITTGVLLALARLAGETAPLLFTAFGNNFLSLNPLDSMGSLPIVLYQYSNAPGDAFHEIAWAGALLITLFVLTLAIIARSHLRRHRTMTDLNMPNPAITPERFSPPAPGAARRPPRTVPSVADAAGDRAGQTLAVRALDFYYNDKRVLKQIDLDIAARRITAVIGPSGCGKSTLLRTFNRMYALYPGQRAEGQVLLEGRNILSPSYPLGELRTRIGMVFQRPTPFPLSIFDNVAWGIRHHERLSSGSLEDRVEQALRDAALWDEVKQVLRRPALNLSGGQQQRLCIARAIALKPAILLLDEPTSALDPIATTKIESLMIELKQRYTLVVVTHNLQQARRIADDTVFLHQGELVEAGPTATLFSTPQNPHTQAYVEGRFG